MQDAETAQRGYLLTGKESYLDPYNSAVQQIPGEIAALEKSLVDNGGRSAALDTLAAATRDKLGELRRTIDLATDGEKAGALALVAAMDRIREAIQTINVSEKQEVNAAQDESISAARTRTTLALALTILLGARMIKDAHRLLQDAIKANNALIPVRTARSLLK